MSQLRDVLCSLVLICLLVPFATLSSSSPPIVFGAYIWGAPQDPAKIDEFTRMVGRLPAIIMWYQDWVHPGEKEFDPILMNAVVTRGAIPMVTWEPWNDRAGSFQPAYSLRAIIAGAHDTYIRQWAHDAHTWGRPFYLRFAHEMNGNWFPWSPGINGNSLAEYVVAWRHVVNIFREEGATNVQWVWSPNVTYPGITPFARLYPGDNYVDWVGLDGYNGGPALSQPWQSFSQIFLPSYEMLVTMTNRPMMIAETASAEIGGNKAAWIKQSLLVDLPSEFPRIRAVIWFNENKETDWRVNSSLQSLTAYRQMVMSLS
ncbi:MAG TPA: glycosyl hydrolase [Ktedonobacteraceae bacterium]